MVIRTRAATGKRNAATYGEQDWHVQMNDAPPPPSEAELDKYEPPMKKLRTGLDSSSPIPPQQDVQASDAGDDDKSSSRQRRDPRESATATTDEGEEQAMAQLHTLFDKLPTDVIYTIFSHLHPSDLLRLARTSRMLRSHLMSKAGPIFHCNTASSISILPSLSPLPAYGKKQGKEWNPQFRIALQTKVNLNGLISCFPRIARPAIALISTILTGSIAYGCVQDAVGLEYIISGFDAEKAFHYIPDVKMLLELLPRHNTLSLYGPTYYRIKSIVDIGAEWATVKNKGSHAEIQELKDKKKRESEEIMNHSTLCKAWERDQSILKEKQDQEMRKARQN
ncbi:hypothetical protein FS837_010210, partial [Tulasnella sp. UAMH 9824]